MTDSPSEFGTTQALHHMLESMRKQQLAVAYKGTILEIGKKLGEGRTKTVYETVIEDASVALAIPNCVDGVDRMSQKWSVALQEPANTDKIRAMGFLTNPLCEAVPITINGVPFSAIKMARYEELPYHIMDGKNVNSSTVKNHILPVDLDDESFEKYFEAIVPDIQLLLKNGVGVGRDSCKKR